MYYSTILYFMFIRFNSFFFFFCKNTRFIYSKTKCLCLNQNLTTSLLQNNLTIWNEILNHILVFNSFTVINIFVLNFDVVAIAGKCRRSVTIHCNYCILCHIVVMQKNYNVKKMFTASCRCLRPPPCDPGLRKESDFWRGIWNTVHQVGVFSALWLRITWKKTYFDCSKAFEGGDTGDDPFIYLATTQHQCNWFQTQLFIISLTMVNIIYFHGKNGNPDVLKYIGKLFITKASE